MGIDNESKGVRVYWPDTKTVTVERNIYHDNTAVNRQEDKNIVIGLTRNNLLPIIQENPVNHEESADESEVEAMSKRIRKPLQKVAVLLGKKQGLAPGVQKLSDEWMAVVEACEDKHAFAIQIEEAEALEPRNLKEARGRPDWLLWEKAIEEELRALKEAGTWEVVDLPAGVNVVGSKWVFKEKKDAAGNVI